MMKARSPHESHRVSTPLELLFDLVFVVAVARAAAGLHHAIAENHAAAGLAGFAMVFFAIWWAWMNFTWFASAYDCDDVPYRVAAFVQITGALIIAAGVSQMFATRTPSRAIVAGYVVMRLALVAQWLRAAAGDPERRVTALRYAGGISALQVAWIAMVFLPVPMIPAFVLLAAIELVIPAWAERDKPTTWHPHHISERYGLFTIIVLGESILSAAMAVQVTIDAGQPLATLAPTIAGGLLVVFSMWWIYFDRPVHDLLTSLPKAIFWGYGHYFVFGAAAAVGAGLAAAVDEVSHHAAIGPVGAGFAVAIPVVVFLLCLWLLHYRPEYRRTRWVGPAAAPLLLLAPFTGQAVLAIGVILAGVVAIKVGVEARSRQ